MTLQRMKWVLVGVPGIFLVTWIALALQARKIDDNALKNAAKNSEWITLGHSQTEQRHSPLTQITPANISSIGKSAPLVMSIGRNTLSSVTTTSAIPSIQRRRAPTL